MKKKQWKPLFILVSLVILFLIVVVISTMSGGVIIPLKETVSVLVSQLPFFSFDYEAMYETILVQIRLSRVIVAALVGAALAVSGVVMQSVFRNPMADPGIIGVSSGGAFGGVIAIYFGFASMNVLFVPLFGFLGALITLIVVYGISTRNGKTSMNTLLLIGIAISSFISSCTSLLISFSDTLLVQEILYWLMGDLNGRDWDHVKILILPVLLSMLFFLYYADDLDILLLGEEQAQNMGISVQRTRNLILLIASLVTGISVALTGAISFVGLVVPHMIRMIIGPTHRFLIPASMIGGAAFLVLADCISRLIIRPAEIQIGIVTAFFGAPFFIFLILQNKRKEEG